MIDPAQEAKLPLEEQLRLYVGRLQLWRLCCNTACHRARACRGDVGDCAARISDWTEAVRTEAQRQRNANDPETQMLRAALMRQIEGLRRTMPDE
jgi:hypothetical protein